MYQLGPERKLNGTYNPGTKGHEVPLLATCDSIEIQAMLTKPPVLAWNHQLAARNLAELYLARNDDLNATLAICDDGRVFTYQSFWDLADRLRCKLWLSGVRPGDRVAVQVEKSMEAPGVFWACVQGGFVFLPLNTAYTPSEVSYFLSDAKAAVFIVTPPPTR